MGKPANAAKLVVEVVENWKRPGGDDGLLPELVAYRAEEESVLPKEVST